MRQLNPAYQGKQKHRADTFHFKEIILLIMGLKCRLSAVTEGVQQNYHI